MLSGVCCGTAPAGGHVEDGAAVIAEEGAGAFTVVSCTIVAAAVGAAGAAVAVASVTAGTLFDTGTALPAWWMQ